MSINEEKDEKSGLLSGIGGGDLPAVEMGTIIGSVCGNCTAQSCWTSGALCGCCSVQTIFLSMLIVCCFALLCVGNVLGYFFFGRHFDQEITKTIENKYVSEMSIQSLFAETNVYCGYSCTQVCFGASNGKECFTKCYDSCNSNNPQESDSDRRFGWMGKYLQPATIQHVGITVQNLNRTTSFFVDVLGGVLVQGAGGDGWFGDEVQQLLTQKELLQAKKENRSMEAYRVADLQKDGTDRLAASYVNFGSLQIELLDYRARTEEDKAYSHLPYKHNTSSPSIVNNMHVAFRIKDSVDLNQFVYDFEKKCNENGYPEVECNRIHAVANEKERKEYGHKYPQYNSFEVKNSSLPFDGWGIVYCKGVEGIQIEFNTVKRNAKKDFDEAFNVFICGNHESCKQEKWKKEK